MYFLSWNLIPRETCQALVTREAEYVKWEKETRSRKVLANGYRLDGFLALRWGLAPYSVHRPRPQAAGCRVCMPAFQTDYGISSTAITPGTVGFAYLTGGLGSYFSCCLIIVQEANFPNSSISELVSGVILTAIIIVRALSFFF